MVALCSYTLPFSSLHPLFFPFPCLENLDPFLSRQPFFLLLFFFLVFFFRIFFRARLLPGPLFRLDLRPALLPSVVAGAHARTSTCPLEQEQRHLSSRHLEFEPSGTALPSIMHTAAGSRLKKNVVFLTMWKHNEVIRTSGPGFQIVFVVAILVILGLGLFVGPLLELCVQAASFLFAFFFRFLASPGFPFLAAMTICLFFPLLQATSLAFPPKHWYRQESQILKNSPST